MNNYVRGKKKPSRFEMEYCQSMNLASLYIYFDYRKYRNSLELARQPITFSECCGGNKTRNANLSVGDSEILNLEISHAV